ncbi:hypothetical protein SRABI134_02014 [Peribacillus sp. Bi134]|nr:hypothetical protein SRABI134_02014 [Peribacillus sp. Bi134]
MIVQGPAELQPGFLMQGCLDAKKNPIQGWGFEVINESRTQR